MPKLTVAICFEIFYDHFHDVWYKDVNQNKISIIFFLTLSTYYPSMASVLIMDSPSVFEIGSL